MTPTQRAAMQAARDALQLAQDNLRDHGDNCFLHDDGEYNSCFCGKDYLVNHLQETVEALDAELAEALAEPAPVGAHNQLVAMVDAAMVEMRNIAPPLKRSECQRLIIAAIGSVPPPRPAPVQEPVYKCRGCGHIYQEEMTSCDCTVSSPPDMEAGVATFPAQQPAPPADVQRLSDVEVQQIHNETGAGNALIRLVEQSYRQKAGLP